MTAIEFLAGWLVRSFALILVGAVVLWLLQVRNPVIRLAAWTALLAGSMAIPALMTALPKLPITVIRSSRRTPAVVAPGDAAIGFLTASAVPDPPPAASPSAAARPLSWLRIVALAYSSVAGALLMRLFTGWIVSVRFLRRCRDCGMAEGGIVIRESRQVASPVTVGIMGPVILLPADWRDWGSTKLGAVLAHERSHIGRHDPALQFVSAIHRAVLWASPASWFLHRSIVRAGEEVSDEDAVTAICDRTSYAEILLEFIQRGVGKSNWIQVAMARYDRPEKRIRRILNSAPVPRRVSSSAMTAIVIAGAWLACLSAAAHPQSAPQAVPATPSVEPTPAGAQLPSAAFAPAQPAVQKNATVHLPEFEVASVKLNDPSVQRLMGAHIYPGGRLQIVQANLKSLAATALGMSYWQISGGEAWTEKENYDIEAKPPENLRSSIKSLRYSWYEIRDAQLRAMLQALLIDRFQLQFHRETRTGDVYVLKQSGKALRLHAVEIPGAGDDATGNSGFESVGYAGGQWDLSNTGMPYLAKFAASFILHAPVLDRTGLNGLYHYRQAIPDEAPNYSGDQTASFTVFLSEAGLKLERTKGPVDVLVIDHAVRPSPN